MALIYMLICVTGCYICCVVPTFFAICVVELQCVLDCMCGVCVCIVGICVMFCLCVLLCIVVIYDTYICVVIYAYVYWVRYLFLGDV